MAEERSCTTCVYFNANNFTCKKTGGCGLNHSKWQPIAKPKAQYTKDEWFDILDAYYCACSDREKGIVETMRNIERNGLILESSLVELVEEVEKIYGEWFYAMEATHSPIKDDFLTVLQSRAIQALKKDHPEFGGKK